MDNEFKKVNAAIIGADGNIFNLLGICQKALKEKGYKSEANELFNRVVSCASYDEALSIMQEYVNPISLDDYCYDED